MKKLFIIFLIGSILLTINPVKSQEYVASFLQIGVGARMLGMGSSGLAAEGDVSSFYWNPAALSDIKNWKLQLMYSTQFGGFSESLASYQHAGIVIPIKENVSLGFNAVRLAVNDIPIYPELEGNIFQRLRNPAIRPDGSPLGYLHDQEIAYFFTFSKKNRFLLDIGWMFEKLPIEIPIGVNFKIIQINLGNEKAAGLGVDIGTMIRFGLNDLLSTERLGRLSFGVHVKDLSETSLTWSTRHQENIRRSYDIGFGYEHEMQQFQSKLYIGYSHFSELQNNYGFEWSFKEQLMLRFGFKDSFFASGAGFSFSKFRIDYAFENHDLGNSHRISADLDLTKNL